MFTSRSAVNLNNLAAELTNKYFSTICEVGKIIEHPKGYKVLITGGQWMGKHGLSNFWYWRKVDKNDKLYGKEYCGYGWK